MLHEKNEISDLLPSNHKTRTQKRMIFWFSWILFHLM